MQKLSVFTLSLIALFAFVSAVGALEKTLTFEWDPYTGEAAQLIDGGSIKIFERIYPDGNYDYTAPLVSVPQEIEAGTGNSTPTSVQTAVTFPDGALTTKAFVARGENENGQSADSNEIQVTLNLTPIPAVADLTAVYNKQAETIDFTWTQSEIDRVLHWKLFQATTSGGPYTEIDQVAYDGSTTTLTSSQSIVPESGVKETYYFVVVAFGENGVNSPDSNEIMVTIDRRPAQKVINLKVTVQ